VANVADQTPLGQLYPFTARTSGSNAISLDVELLELDWSPREYLSKSHVVRLAETASSWPPILVDRATNNVIDGAHRVMAAKRLGHKRIQAVLFTGSEADARIESIRTNTSHGLPLTLAERKRSARLLLTSRPEMSDRAIAEICALSPKTIGVLRSRHEVRPAVIGNLGQELRRGRDGYWRPTRGSARESTGPRKLKVDDSEPKVNKPFQTVREPHTSVALQSADDVVAVDTSVVVAVPKEGSVSCRNWELDLACSSTKTGAEFARWLGELGQTVDRSTSFLEAVPLSRVYLVMDDLHSMIETLTLFADALGQRVNKGR
jgi:hypothetical protein